MRDRACGCAELAANESLCADTKCRRVCWLFEAAADEVFKFLFVADDDGRLGVEEGGDDVAEVSRVGTEGDGGAVGGRFDHVLAAAVAEAAADESDVGGAPPGAELDDGVDQQD